MNKLPRHVADVNRKIYNKYNKEMKKARKTVRLVSDKEAKITAEIELANISREVEKLGFSFFPDLYVIPYIDMLKDISKTYK